MKILYIVASLNSGGVSKLLYDYCSRMNDDFKFDFVITDPNEGVLEKQFIELGGRIYRIPQFRQSVIGHNRQLKKIIKNGQYDIVHDNCDYRAYFSMLYAKKYRVNVRIAHTHRTSLPSSKIGQIVANFFIKKIKKEATDLFACGKLAGIKMWGKDVWNRGQIHVMTNAIDCSRYQFSLEKKYRIKKELGLNDSYVIGNVGRLVPPKNHSFILDLFSQVKNELNGAKLLLIGDGELFNDIKKMIEERELTNDVLMLGQREDIPMLLNAMDVFVLPSLYEGLPIVLVEAQANGLPALVSNLVTDEVKYSDMIQYLAIDKGYEEWIHKLTTNELHRYERPKELDEYEIQTAVLSLENYYWKLLESQLDTKSCL